MKKTKVAIVAGSASRDDAPVCPEGARLILLTQGKYAIVDEEDYELVSRFKWRCDFQANTYYAYCQMCIGKINSKRVMRSMFLHRLIMRPPKNMEIDHSNHNGYDCRRSNMRICNKRQNQQNCLSRKGSSSKYKGVSWEKYTQKWDVRIKVNGKQIHDKRYNSEIEAARAYDRAAIKYFGEFACLNFPT